MGNMKRLYTAMQELGQALQEQDPVTFENAPRVIGEVQDMVLSVYEQQAAEIEAKQTQTAC